jgi:hypothetical protein
MQLSKTPFTAINATTWPAAIRRVFVLGAMSFGALALFATVAPETAQGGKCGFDSDCKGNGKCKGGTCGNCSFASDCSVGKCGNNRCGACSFDSDCRGGRCAHGRCSNAL